MRNLNTLRMPEHMLPGENPENPVLCRGGFIPGYASMLLNGRLHCRCCGWTTEKAIVTTYSPDTNSTYLTWREMVAAESNGWVIVSISDRPGTTPMVVGPFNNRGECNKARRRLRRKWQREEEDFGIGKHKITTFVKPLWKEQRS